MSLNIEISEVMNTPGKVYSWAETVKYNLPASAEDKEISSVVNAWAKEIGKSGHDANHEIAAFVTKSIQPDEYNAPDALLDLMFERGSIGEFDDARVIEEPKNTLVAYLAAKGGSVPKSYVDTKNFDFDWKNRQVETEISFRNLRDNGFRTIANLTTFAREALNNYIVFDAFTKIDSLSSYGDESFITESTAKPTATSMDALSQYAIEHTADGDVPILIGFTKYMQDVANMSGYSSLMSDSMKDEFNRYGLINLYKGCQIAHISSARKTGDGKLLLPNNRIFGISGKIGELDMKGDINVYESEDINRERIHLKIADFTYGFCVSRPEKVSKVVLSYT